MSEPSGPPAAPPGEEPGGAAPPTEAEAAGGDVAGNGGCDPEQLAELEQRAATFEDQARRALADLDNSRKRQNRDVERARADERARVAREFLPLVDHLDLALGHAEANPSAIVAGVEHVLAEAVEVLRRLGFERIDQVGEQFDPTKHEAVTAVDVNDAEPGTVIHVVRPGYGEGIGQLRPASVVVSTGRQ